MPFGPSVRAAAPAAAVAALRDEAFLDATNIVSSTLTYGVNRPTKNGSNPIWPTLASSAADWGIGYVSAMRVGGQTRTYCTCFDSSAITVHLAYSTVSDTTTVSRPSLGIVSFAGNTNNNLCSPAGLTRNQYRVVYAPDVLPATPFILVAYVLVASVLAIQIYVSADGKSWGSAVKTISDPAGTGYCEPMSLWRRSDGRWVIYYQDIQTGTADYGSIRRHLGMLLGPSDGSLTGTWTNSGRVLSAASGSEQLYHTGAWRDGEIVYVPIGVFDGTAPPPIGTFSGTANRVNRVALYTARADSGSTLTLADDNWIPTTGVYGEWDGGELFIGNGVATVGDTWNFYMGGDGNTHHQSPESIRLMGTASLGRGRIGQASGTGSVVLSTVTAAAGASVTVNSSGTVAVELLDGSNNVIAGYAQADCEAVPSDTYGHTVKWNGVSRTPATFRVKLYATAATIYHVTVREA